MSYFDGGVQVSDGKTSGKWGAKMMVKLTQLISRLDKIEQKELYFKDENSRPGRGGDLIGTQ